MFDNLTAEEQRLLRSDPRPWASTFLNHPDDPERGYDFHDTKGETKLNYLLSDNGPMNPDNWGNINVLKFCRGGLKTTVLTMLSTWMLHMHPTTNIYMTAPREGQVREFSERLDDKIRECGLDRRRDVDNIQRKVFEVATKNDDGTRNIYKAKFQADSGWGEGDALRGPHSHVGILDEFQDITRSAFETFTPAIDRELPHAGWAPVIFLIGTPKGEGSFYHTLWQYTDQRTWDRDSLSWEAASTREEFTPSEELLDEMGYDADEDIRGHEVAGWHLDAYNSPIHTPQQIARDKASFTPRKFTNEMEARFYSAEDDLLSIDDVRDRFFDERDSFARERHSPDSFVVVGVDWGGGSDKNAADTVVTVVEWESFDSGRSTGEVLTLDFLDQSLTPDEEKRSVEQYVLDYDADRAVVDYGHGHKSMMDLQDGNGTIRESGHPDAVVGAKYGNVQDKSSIKWESSSGNRRFFTCDKTTAVEQFVEYVRGERITCPSASLSMDSDSAKGAKIVEHLTAPYKDYTTTPSGSKKIRVQTDDHDNDDALDALVFTVLANEHLSKPTTVPHIASSSRF